MKTTKSLLRVSALAAALAATAVAQEPPAAPAAPEIPAWQQVLDRLSFYGDLRLRQESNWLEDAEDRHRQRLRFRLGAEYEVSEGLTAGLRVTTGNPDDPNSPHVDLGDVFNRESISIDRLYLTLRPESWSEGYVTAGKFAHPVVRNPVYGELVWDADVQPEGAVVGATYAEVGPFDELGFVLGGYSLLEQSGGEEAFAVTSQVSGGFAAGAEARATLAVGYTFYNDTSPDGSTAILGDNSGNALLDNDGNGQPDAFASNFGVLDVIAALAIDSWSVPVQFAVEYIENVRAEIDGDTGFALGVAAGRSSKKGDWRAYYNWQTIEQDAVFSPVAGDDLLLTTNAESHVIGVNHMLRDNVGLHLWALVSALDEPPAGFDDDELWRVRLELNVKL